MHSEIEERIDRYVQGHMELEELNEFEKFLSANEPIREEAIFRKKVVAGLKNKNARLFVNQLQQRRSSHNDTFPKESESTTMVKRISDSRKKTLWILAIAASLLVAVSTIFFGGETSAQRVGLILDESYIQNQLTSEPSGGIQLKQKLVARDFEGYIKLRNTLAFEDNSKNNWIKLYSGYAYLQLGKPENCILELSKVNVKSPEEIAQKNFYLAVAHSIEGDNTKAADILKNSPSVYPWDKSIASLKSELGL